MKDHEHRQRSVSDVGFKCEATDRLSFPLESAARVIRHRRRSILVSSVLLQRTHRDMRCWHRPRCSCCRIRHRRGFCTRQVWLATVSGFVGSLTIMLLRARRWYTLPTFLTRKVQSRFTVWSISVMMLSTAVHLRIVKWYVACWIVEATPVSVCANAENWNGYTGSVTSSAVCEFSGARDQDHRFFLEFTPNASPRLFG